MLGQRAEWDAGASKRGGTLKEWWRDAGRREFRKEGREADLGVRVRHGATTRRGKANVGEENAGATETCPPTRGAQTAKRGRREDAKAPWSVRPTSPRGAPKAQGECKLGGTPARSSMFSMRATERARGVDV